MRKHAYVLVVAALALFAGSSALLADQPSGALSTIALEDPLTEAPLLLGYDPDLEESADQYQVFVVCHKPDGTLSVWAASVVSQPAVLALESDWGVDLEPIRQFNPQFADELDDWFVEHGYPPTGVTWHLLWNGPDAAALADWVAEAELDGGTGENCIIFIWNWLRWILCEFFGIGCDPDPVDPTSRLIHPTPMGMATVMGTGMVMEMETGTETETATGMGMATVMGMGTGTVTAQAVLVCA